MSSFCYSFKEIKINNSNGDVHSITLKWNKKLMNNTYFCFKFLILWLKIHWIFEFLFLVKKNYNQMSHVNELSFSAKSHNNFNALNKIYIKRVLLIAGISFNFANYWNMNHFTCVNNICLSHVPLYWNSDGN